MKLILYTTAIITVLLTNSSFNKMKIESTGIDIFLKSPNNYTFKCGCDLGEVLNASLQPKGNMTVNYYYMCGGKKFIGLLEGKFSMENNEFIGTYNTENRYFYGPIKFSFNEKGEADGIWDKGVGTIAMHLKSK